MLKLRLIALKDLSKGFAVKLKFDFFVALLDIKWGSFLFYVSGNYKIKITPMD